MSPQFCFEFGAERVASLSLTHAGLGCCSGIYCKMNEFILTVVINFTLTAGTN